MKMSGTIRKQSAGNGGNRKHNLDKEFRAKKYADRIVYPENENIIIIDRKPIEMFEDLFGNRSDEHNAKNLKNRHYDKLVGVKGQKKSCKNWHDFYKKNDKTKCFQEIILQCGNEEDAKNPSTRFAMIETLKQMGADFIEKYPNFKVLTMIIHDDEATPHMHIVFTPVYKAKNGYLDISMDNAMKEMGFKKEKTIINVDTLKSDKIFTAVRNRLVENMATNLKNYNIDLGHVHCGREKNLTVNDYKDFKDRQKELDMALNKVEKISSKKTITKKNIIEPEVLEEFKNIAIESIAKEKELLNKLEELEENRIENLAQKIKYDNLLVNHELEKKELDKDRKELELEKGTFKEFLENNNKDILKKEKKALSDKFKAEKDVFFKTFNKKVDDKVNVKFEKLVNQKLEIRVNQLVNASDLVGMATNEYNKIIDEANTIATELEIESREFKLAAKDLLKQAKATNTKADNRLLKIEEEAKVMANTITTDEVNRIMDNAKNNAKELEEEAVDRVREIDKAALIHWERKIDSIWQKKVNEFSNYLIKAFENFYHIKEIATTMFNVARHFKLENKDLKELEKSIEFEQKQAKKKSRDDYER